MISSGEYNQIYLRNVCGWLKLQLTGNGEIIKSISLKGNNNEQVAGELYIGSATATATLASETGSGSEDNGVGGSLVFEDTILTEVSLVCPDGVTLGEEPTDFYIALPPQTFTKGVTVTVNFADNTQMTKSTNNMVVIERNTVSPMSKLVADPQPKNNEIWYTSADGRTVTPYKTDVFGAKIESNTYENGSGVITFDNDVTTIGYMTFAYYRIKSITIPDSVTSIGRYTFENCSELTSVTIGNSVTKIGECTFYGCSSLKNITFADSVTSIGEGAFCGCSNLTSITIPNSVTHLGLNPFYNCANLTEFNGKFVSADKCCLITDGVLKSFAIGCAITEYTIPNSATSIAKDAFVNSSNLASVTIGNQVTSIGYYAFYHCTNLTSVNLLESVTMIGNYAFRGCSLKDVYCKSTTPPTADRVSNYSWQVFDENAADRKIYVPAESVNAYKAADGWSRYAADIEPHNFE